MRPERALAQALLDANEDWATTTIIRLEAIGFTVARTQDARDGEALRLLREALGPDDTFDVSVTHKDPWVVEAWHLPSLRHLAKTTAGTIAEAADACREALA